MKISDSPRKFRNQIEENQCNYVRLQKQFATYIFSYCPSDVFVNGNNVDFSFLRKLVKL